MPLHRIARPALTSRPHAGLVADECFAVTVGILRVDPAERVRVTRKTCWRVGLIVCVEVPYINRIAGIFRLDFALKQIKDYFVVHSTAAKLQRFEIFRRFFGEPYPSVLTAPGVRD